MISLHKIFTAFFILAKASSFSMGDTLKPVGSQKRHGVGIEIGGGSLVFSVNYRYQVIFKDKVTLGASIGAGYLFDQITNYELFSVPVGVEVKLRLKRKIYLVNKLGSSFSICKKPYPNDFETRRYYIRNKINDGTGIRRVVEPLYSYFIGINLNFERIDFSLGPALLMYKSLYDANPYFAPWAGFNIYYKF